MVRGGGLYPEQGKYCLVCLSKRDKYAAWNLGESLKTESGHTHILPAWQWAVQLEKKWNRI